MDDLWTGYWGDNQTDDAPIMHRTPDFGAYLPSPAEIACQCERLRAERTSKRMDEKLEAYTVPEIRVRDLDRIE